MKYKDINHLIDCEIDCIKSGNTLTPFEQAIAIETAENIKTRIQGFLGFKIELKGNK